MSNVKSKASHRLLAALLSIAMVFSMIPFSMVAHAATTEYPDAFTVSVKDENGDAVEGATVEVSSADTNWELFKSGTTDANGVAAISNEEIETALNDASMTEGTVNVVVTKEGYEDGGQTTTVVVGEAAQNIDITLSVEETPVIDDVTIEGKTLTYTGEAQELVSVTEVEGDTVKYYLNGATDPVTEVPTATDAATYSVRVVVTREGYEPLDKTVDAVINPAKIDIDIAPVTGLKYNEAEQELVTLTGEFAEGDIVTWTVGEDSVNTTDIPKGMAVGNYTITLSVDRGANYTKFEKTVNVEIALGEIDLGDLKVEAIDRTYDTTEKELLAVTKDGDYTLEYSIDNQSSWVKDVIPTATDAGEYVIYVKATKEGYNPVNTPAFPIKVTIAKAPQSLEFADNALSEIILGTANEYDFTASGENLSGKDIEYSLVDATAENVATITADGKVTVANAGIVTVKAFRAGNENYMDAVVYKTIVVKNASTELVTFDSDSENYVLDENGNVSEKEAIRANTNDNGTLTYSIDNTNIGLAINPANGKVTVTEEWKLMSAMWNNNGSVTVTVTVNKAEGSLEGKKWVLADGAWNPQNTNEKVYAADTDSYKILITFAEAPSFGEVCKIADPDPVSGWYNAEYPATITPIDATKYTIALDDAHWTKFGDSVTIEDQGSDTHYVFLKDTNGRPSAPIAVDIDVDTVKPEANRIKVEYAKSAMDEFLEVITLGFYNPSVTVRFTAYDETSGIDYFTWNYTKEDGASSIDHPESVTGQKVNAVQDATNKTKYTAEFTITADEANQYRGYLTVTATDKANNTSAVKEDSGNVFVIDTVNPEMSIKYEGAEPYTSEIDAIDTVHYFDGDVEVELTVTEANFYPGDVTVTVTKDGQPYDYGTVNWGNRNAEDKTVGTFTLAGDGDYIVTVTATDKSGNLMDPYTSETITVDTKAPEIDSVYIAEDRDGDGKKETQNITITIDEHNFRASDITVAVEALDINDAPVSVKDIQAYVQKEANWTSNGDIRTLVLESTGENKMLVDAIYKLTINYMDLSDNAAITEVTESSLIDHTGPTDVSIEIVTEPIETFFEVITFGFYNPSVTIKFTAYDEEAGVKSFTWNYTKENGASDVNRATDVETTTVAAIQDTLEPDKFTATITLPDTDATQLRGYLAAFATDNYGYASDKVTDDENIIVVDTIAPEISVEYSKSSRDIDGKAYYNGDVEATITVKEANFYATDVVVKVSKNGAAATAVTPAWTTDESNGDIHYGKFTMTGDGHYIVTVEYTDKSDNFDEEKSTYTSHEITIDTIKPVINVEYQNKTVANTLTDREGNERKYFADTQTAVITINEHNFISDEVEFSIIAKDVTGAELDVATLNSKTAWSVDSTGDVHTITITYPGDANYTFDVAYTDKATNAAEDYATDYFTVDKTDPTNLTVSYSTSVLDTVLESVTFGFYNAKMTVTLTAEDPTSEVHSFLYSYLNAAGVSNVNAELINEAIQAADIKYSEDRKTATVTFEIPKMVLGNDNQFNGTVEFTATDRAGNETDAHKETKRIVVDNIAPTAQVSYNEATNVVGDISYYNGNINATVTINEANFYANDVQVMVSKDGGAATAVTPTWTNNSVDVHVGTFTLTEDGDYIVTINYTDKSSNQMAAYTSKQMTIDTDIEAPAYTINGAAKTEVGGAYKGDATIGFSFDDQNFDTKTIKLTRTRFDKVEDVTETFVKVTDNDKGGSGSFTIPSEVGNDGIYVLTIGMTDKAKHTTESEIKFTINRFGSVYEYSDELVTLIKDGGQYITSVEDDLVITEYNADRILEGSLKILITRDGETVDVDFASNPENINDQVGIGESGWYQYVYTIKASNFEQDGVYKISLTSAYAADDSENNESTSVPENSIDEAGNEILDTMNFTVDSVAPEIRNIVNLDKAIADVDKIVDGKLNVKYTIVDVGGLKTIEIIVNGETIQTLTEEDIADNLYNFTGSFDLEEQDGTTAHKVQIKVTDLAGNVTDTNSEDFLKAHSDDNENSTYVFFNEVTVSRNFFVRWYANTGLFWGSIAGVVVLAGAIWFLIAFKRKKKEEESK